MTFTTVKPLRYRTFRFHKRPQILPEISDWSQAMWNIRVFGDLDDSDPTKRKYFVQGYVPLDVRMTDVERTVINICGGLAHCAGLSCFFDSVESSMYSKPFDVRQTKYWGEDPFQRRRVNGLQPGFRGPPAEQRLSLTWDGGRELPEHQELTAELGRPVYFCGKRSSWQRGTKENTNRLLREYLPKNNDLRQFSQQDLNEIADKIKTRPRKVLDWGTSSGAFTPSVRATAPVL